MNTALGEPRWRGQRGRLEVWYLTATDAATGAGIWIHHETVAPTGDDAPRALGWIAVFPPDRPPVLERFGPTAVTPGAGGPSWHEVGDCVVDPGRLSGSAGTTTWDLTFEDDAEPLYTFPRWAWHRELLPGAQIVPAPSAHVHGEVIVSGEPLAFDGRGALARINGHGSAQRWGWLHADLGGDGVLEIVSGTARRPGLRRLPPLAFVQLRIDGESDWPSRSLLTAPRLRTTLRPDGFSVTGRHRGRSLDVDVTLPEGRTVDVRYVDPDGGEATCRNSERARAVVTTERRGRRHSWTLEGTAHAEVGFR